MEEIDRLLEVMNRLRGENGCNWDKKQTHDSLIPYVLEEAYEVIDAIEKIDYSNLKEELGDLLFQIVFHSKLASESGIFTFQEVVQGISDKLIRRHPHVFSSAQNLTPEEVVMNWEVLKANEKKTSSLDSILDSVPLALPALMRAEKLQNKASSVGFDWEDPLGIIEKIKEECSELEVEINKNKNSQGKIQEELGDLFFSLVNLSRYYKINTEQTLRMANQKFEKRFRKMEANILSVSKQMKELTTEEWEEQWQKSKKADNP